MSETVIVSSACISCTPLRVLGEEKLLEPLEERQFDVIT